MKLVSLTTRIRKETYEDLREQVYLQNVKIQEIVDRYISEGIMKDKHQSKLIEDES